MIDLRWVIREIKVPPDYWNTKKVLQYRQQTNLPEEGLQERIWSEWKDVPFEHEE